VQLYLILAKGGTANSNEVIWGDILIIINAVSYTIYFVLVKPLMLKYNPVMIIRWIFTIGLIMILPFGLTEFNEIKWMEFNTIDITTMALVVFTGTFLAYLFNIYGIKILGASAAGFYIYTQPFFATFIAMIFLNESLQLYKVAAALLIFTGVYLANKPVKNA
jgi:drug/metabolite transporter (DMT)-like permease